LDTGRRGGGTGGPAASHDQAGDRQRTSGHDGEVTPSTTSYGSGHGARPFSAGCPARFGGRRSGATTF
jgi:hypothetical protein